MRKIIFIVSLILILSAYFVSSITTFVYNETEQVSLWTDATDPDNQKLSYKYSKPLNNKGDWQTDYGDSGEYKIIITVSDGELSASEDVLVVVNKKEMPPTIDKIEPNAKEVEIDEGKILKFKVWASDLNKDELSYTWFLNGKKADEGNEFAFSTDYNSKGSYEIRIVISDGKYEASNGWDVEVKDLDINGLLDSIEDIEVTETEEVRLNLPDFKGYGLSYEISDPVGGDNYWLTNYTSEGEYLAKVSVEGKGFSGSKDVKVVVLNKDRPAEFEIKGIYFVKENEDLRIELKANDPDGDKISFSASELPEGSSFEDDVFEWKTDYDVIKKENFVDYALDKFHLLTKSFKVNFVAKTRHGDVKKYVILIVQDNNRPFVIEDLEPIEVDEGEIVKISPKYNDPDNDYVLFSYSGWMNKDAYQTDYGDAGEYYVKVEGTDGYYSSYKMVKIVVKKSNRKPVFSKIKNFEIDENQSLKIRLEADDPDSDEIDFSSDNLPEGSVLEEGIFTWQPDFNFVGKEEGKKSITLDFRASDSKEEAFENSTITVYDKNRAPEIRDVSKEVVAWVNEPITFWVDAEDFEGDMLIYRWVFGSFEEYEATAAHERIFTKKGDKKIKVIVSDGFEEVEYEWNVKVVGSEEKKVSKPAAKPKPAPAPAPIKPLNNPPEIIDASNDAIVYVNQPIVLNVNAQDKDGDKLSYEWVFGVFDNLKAGNAIQRTFTSTGDKKIKVVVSDGSDKVDYEWNIQVISVEKKPVIKPAAKPKPAPAPAPIKPLNNPPEIVGVSQNVVTYVNNPVVITVNAQDIDGDKLSYEWVFGLFDRYKGNNNVQKTFTSAGDKKVKVIVSDGKDKAEYEWNVRVISQPTVKPIEVVEPTEPDRSLWEKHTIVQFGGDIIEDTTEEFFV